MRWISFAFLILGTALSVVGWFFDRVRHMDKLLVCLAPNYFYGLKGLNDLAADARHALSTTHPGFRPILELWPEVASVDKVAFVGRSVAFTVFGARVMNDFELILYDANSSELAPRWRHAAAERSFAKEFDSRVLRIGGIVFWVGITITVASGVFEFLNS